ncbi:hypothetical protein M1590_03505 [Candidatus Marsarchaeota archaeon]|nr:hypothetical protein [Candidatus Marsarchaeota archaeon]
MVDLITVLELVGIFGIPLVATLLSFYFVYFLKGRQRKATLDTIRKSSKQFDTLLSKFERFNKIYTSENIPFLVNAGIYIVLALILLQFFQSSDYNYLLLATFGSLFVLLIEAKLMDMKVESLKSEKTIVYRFRESYNLLLAIFYICFLMFLYFGDMQGAGIALLSNGLANLTPQAVKDILGTVVSAFYLIFLQVIIYRGILPDKLAIQDKIFDLFASKKQNKILVEVDDKEGYLSSIGKSLRISDGESGKDYYFEWGKINYIALTKKSVK